MVFVECRVLVRSGCEYVGVMLGRMWELGVGVV